MRLKKTQKGFPFKNPFGKRDPQPPASHDSPKLPAIPKLRPLKQPTTPKLTVYPPLRQFHTPGRAGFQTTPISNNPYKLPRFQVRQSVVYSGQGYNWEGTIT